MSVTDTITPAPRRWSVRAVLTAGLVVAALVQPLAALLSAFDWRADLLCHFREPALWITLLACVLLIRKRPRIAVLLGVLAVFQAGPLFRYAWPNPVPPDPSSTARLRILMANVLVDNSDYEDLARLLRRERPDIVGLVEYTPRWQSGLSELRAEFPYRVEAPAGAEGLALFFREKPLTMDPAQRLRPDTWPVLHATFQFAGRTRHLWLAHPRSPLKRRARRSGNPELAALAERVRETGGSRIVIGDLNTTDASGNFAALLHRSGLRDSRLGFGRQGSFPSDFFYRIAIDHALISPDLAVTGRRLGPVFGSDHLPMIVDLAPAADSVTNAATQGPHSSD